jgi:hypothetical protein
LFLTHQATAQTSTDSPYSQYGIGLLNTKAFNGNFGMSGLGYAWRPTNYKPNVYDSLARSNAQFNDRRTNYINPKNPASYSNLSLTVFEAGINGQNVQAQSGDQSQYYSNAQLSHVALAFPIGNKWGAGLGIRPYTKRGYEYSIPGSVNGDEFDFNFNGSGGINQVYASTAFQFLEHYAFGVNASYLFGTVVDERRVIYDPITTDDFFNTVDQSRNQVSDFSFELGLQYSRELSKNYQMVLGVVSSPLSELSAEQNRLIRTYEGPIGNESIKDTITNIRGKEQNVQIAPTIGGGVSLERKGKWLIGLDYTNNNWNDLQVAKNIRLVNSHQFILGFEKFNDLSAFGSYLKQLGIRAGAHYNTSLVQIDGEDVAEFGISFGISLPLRKTFSTLNAAIEVGQRGKNENNLTQENYIGVQFGVTINDRWFIKRKYD